MAIIPIDDFVLLKRHLNLLDLELATINIAIRESADPHTDGLCDAGEYFIGHGFVAIQHYLKSTYSRLNITQAVAFSVRPKVTSNLTFAEAINAGANYWKHVDEWIMSINKGENASLKVNALRTLEKLEIATPWAEYTCSNLLAILGDRKKLELSSLFPQIAEWHNNLVSKTTKS